MPKPTEDFAQELQVLRKAFGVTVAQEKYDPKSFGDAILLLKGPRIDIRITRDRGSIFVDLAPKGRNPGKWLWASAVLEALDIEHEPTPKASLAATVEVLASNAERVVSHVGGPTLVQRVRSLFRKESRN